MLKLSRFFPDSMATWKKYWKITLPVMLGSIMYSLNGFVDNFMVGTISGGAGALSAANTWTAILLGVYTSIGITGAIFLAQYYNNKQYEFALQIQRLRINLCFGIGLLFGILSWVIPRELIVLMAGQAPSGINVTQSDIDVYNNIINLGIQYIRIISIAWLIMGFTAPMSIVLSETGHGRFTFYTTFIGLITNVIGNSVLIYGLKFGVEGAAIASLLARAISFIIYLSVMFYKHFKIIVLPFSLHKISPQILKQYFRRGFFILSTILGFIFIEMRNPLFARGYPIGSIGGVPVGALNVLALTFAVMNIFLTAFSAIDANAANFVGLELGQNNIKQAKINSDQLKGFNTLIAVVLSLILLVISFIIPYMEFLVVNEEYKTVILQNVKYSLWPVCIFYPWWIWFETSKINSMAGGKVNIQTIIEFTMGLFQVGILFLLTYYIIPVTQISFAFAFALFFITDIFKGIAFEIAYHKLDWAHNITKEYAKAEQDIAHALHVDDISTT